MSKKNRIERTRARGFKIRCLKKNITGQNVNSRRDVLQPEHPGGFSLKLFNLSPIHKVEETTSSVKKGIQFFQVNRNVHSLFHCCNVVYFMNILSISN